MRLNTVFNHQIKPTAVWGFHYSKKKKRGEESDAGVWLVRNTHEHKAQSGFVSTRPCTCAAAFWFFCPSFFLICFLLFSFISHVFFPLFSCYFVLFFLVHSPLLFLLLCYFPSSFSPFACIYFFLFQFILFFSISSLAFFFFWIYFWISFLFFLFIYLISFLLFLFTFFFSPTFFFAHSFFFPPLLIFLFFCLSSFLLLSGFVLDVCTRSWPCVVARGEEACSILTGVCWRTWD